MSHYLLLYSVQTLLVWWQGHHHLAECRASSHFNRRLCLWEPWEDSASLTKLTGVFSSSRQGLISETTSAISKASDRARMTQLAPS